MISFKWAVLSAFAVAVHAGNVVWDGTFNNFNSASDFDKCWLPLLVLPLCDVDTFVGSWASQVGTYQWVCDVYCLVQLCSDARDSTSTVAVPPPSTLLWIHHTRTLLSPRRSMVLR